MIDAVRLVSSSLAEWVQLSFLDAAWQWGTDPDLPPLGRELEAWNLTEAVIPLPTPFLQPGASSWILLATAVDGPKLAAVGVVLGALSTAFSDVVVDSIVVERSRGTPQTTSGSLQARDPDPHANANTCSEARKAKMDTKASQAPEL